MTGAEVIAILSAAAKLLIKAAQEIEKATTAKADAVRAEAGADHEVTSTAVSDALKELEALQDGLGGDP